MAEIVKMAEKAKLRGNELYKKRDFDGALAAYGEAIAINPKEAKYISNKAAVFFMMKEYDKCIELCREAIEIGSQNRAKFELIAKLYKRIGDAYVKKRMWDEGIQAYKSSLLEHPSDKIKREIQKVTKWKNIEEKKAYLNPEIALEHKQKGNDFFKEGKWVDAIAEYSESLKRDPKNHKVYSNRAACYSKLMDWQRALDDCNACIKIESNFAKIYVRKGRVQFFLKQFHKALATFDAGLKIDPNYDELKQDRMRCMATIQQQNQSGQVDPARAREAMKDPEIQQILRDPMINKVLEDSKNDPKAAAVAMQDPSVRAKLDKLMAAGVLQMGGKRK